MTHNQQGTRHKQQESCGGSGQVNTATITLTAENGLHPPSGSLPRSSDTHYTIILLSIRGAPSKFQIQLTTRSK
ncbi:hypothetical protein E2C01_096341 [Portunus trituberculatus]|uniref:Uncharacterized protein n=1 Tax=Portunus trituberculatus TaxID=210409 RepID=A0A5B7K1H2_PORTR|nr:hypothetical protein [Portunus trituberculatus]